MGFRNFLISIIKSLIIFLLVSLIFSAVTLDVPSLMKNVFGDIFTYASPDVQKQVVSKLTETCSSLEIENEEQNYITIFIYITSFRFSNFLIFKFFNII